MPPVGEGELQRAGLPPLAPPGGGSHSVRCQGGSPGEHRAGVPQECCPLALSPGQRPVVRDVDAGMHDDPLPAPHHPGNVHLIGAGPERLAA